MNFALTAAMALCLSAVLALPAIAAPLSAETAADRAALARAVKQFEAAQAKSLEIEARITKASRELDSVIADEAAARARLNSRMVMMYRLDDGSYISLLLGASSIQDFVGRLDMLTRMARQDAKDSRELRAARVRAGRSSEELIALQANAARLRDKTAVEVTRAREELAASQAALNEYEARMAAIPKVTLSARPDAAPAASAPAAAPALSPRAAGAWQTGVASHYGRNFTGQGANGEAIGPYSMIVAHKTLPFGTTIEFEYDGKRAVAKVADRGPYTAGRDFDLGPGVVRVLDFSGVHEVRYRIIAR